MKECGLDLQRAIEEKELESSRVSVYFATSGFGFVGYDVILKPIPRSWYFQLCSVLVAELCTMLLTSGSSLRSVSPQKADVAVNARLSSLVFQPGPCGPCGPLGCICAS